MTDVKREIDGDAIVADAGKEMRERGTAEGGGKRRKRGREISLNGGTKKSKLKATKVVEEAEEKEEEAEERNKTHKEDVEGEEEVEEWEMEGEEEEEAEAEEITAAKSEFSF